MSLKIHVALCQTIPTLCSSQFTVTSSLEVNLDENVLLRQVELLHSTIQRAFAACERVVAADLAHHQPASQIDESAERARRGAAVSSREHCSLEDAYQPLMATQRQIQTLYGMTVRHRLDLRDLLYDRFRKRQLYDLSRSEAGCLIGELQKLDRAAGRSFAPR